MKNKKKFKKDKKNLKKLPLIKVKKRGDRFALQNKLDSTKCNQYSSTSSAKVILCPMPPQNRPLGLNVEYAILDPDTLKQLESITKLDPSSKPTDLPLKIEQVLKHNCNSNSNVFQQIWWTINLDPDFLINKVKLHLLKNSNKFDLLELHLDKDILQYLYTVYISYKGKYTHNLDDKPSSLPCWHAIEGKRFILRVYTALSSAAKRGRNFLGFYFGLEEKDFLVFATKSLLNALLTLHPTSDETHEKTNFKSDLYQTIKQINDTLSGNNEKLEELFFLDLSNFRINKEVFFELYGKEYNDCPLTRIEQILLILLLNKEYLKEIIDWEVNKIGTNHIIDLLRNFEIKYTFLSQLERFKSSKTPYSLDTEVFENVRAFNQIYNIPEGFIFVNCSSLIKEIKEIFRDLDLRRFKPFLQSISLSSPTETTISIFNYEIKIKQGKITVECPILKVLSTLQKWETEMKITDQDVFPKRLPDGTYIYFNIRTHLIVMYYRHADNFMELINYLMNNNKKITTKSSSFLRVQVPWEYKIEFDRNIIDKKLDYFLKRRMELYKRDKFQFTPVTMPFFWKNINKASIINKANVWRKIFFGNDDKV